MTDEKYIFIQDCKDKKITARSARSTRTHCGKRGSVKFPSDYMSKKELEAMNGVCERYRLNEPVSYEVFKSWPKHIQEDYIKLLRKKFNVPLGYISKMVFGKEQSLLSWYIKRYGLDVGDTSIRKKIAWDEKGFKEWCNKDKESDAQEKVDDGLTKLGENLATPAIEPFNDVFSSAATSEINRMVDEINKVWDETFGSMQTTIDEIYEAAKKADGYLDREEYLRDVVMEFMNNQKDEYHSLLVIPRNGTMTFTGIRANCALATIKSILCNDKVNITISWEAVE